MLRPSPRPHGGRKGILRGGRNAGDGGRVVVVVMVVVSVVIVVVVIVVVMMVVVALVVMVVELVLVVDVDVVLVEDDVEKDGLVGRMQLILNCMVIFVCVIVRGQ